MKILLHLFTLLLLSPFLFYHAEAQQLTLYSGRSKALVEPMIQKFQQETGIRVNVRYGGTTQLAVAIMEEGRRSPADLFWAQDAGALGAVHQADLLAALPTDIKVEIPTQFQNTDGTWIATSGRARVFAYHTRRIGDSPLPESVFDLTKPEWRGRIGWAPANASFQSFITAMREIEGEDRTRQWLMDMRENGARAYNNNSSILQAIAAGEISGGLTNHYYLSRLKENQPNTPVSQTFFKEGDSGNLVNVAGLAILKSSRNSENALKFIEFMLSQESQLHFLNEVYEYPAITGLGDQDAELESVLKLTPDLNLDLLRDLEKTLSLLREVGLL